MPCILNKFNLICCLKHFLSTSIYVRPLAAFIVVDSNENVMTAAYVDDAFQMPDFQIEMTDIFRLSSFPFVSCDEDELTKYFTNDSHAPH